MSLPHWSISFNEFISLAEEKIQDVFSEFVDFHAKNHNSTLSEEGYCRKLLEEKEIAKKLKLSTW
jgi:hypothetical protein